MRYMPQEILMQIACSLNHAEDVKALRLVSRDFFNPATQQLFGVVYVRFSLQSFEKLRSVSGHPGLKHVVHTVIYEQDEDIGACWSEEPFQFVDKARLCEQLVKLPALRIPTSPALSTYRTRADERQLGTLRLEEMSLLTSAMINFPHLSKIDLRLPKTPNISSPKAFQYISPEDLFGLWEQLRKDGVDSFCTLMRAASIAKSPIRRLTTSNLSRGISYKVLGLNFSNARHTKDIFENLTHLDFHINTWSNDPESEVMLREGRLASLLAYATRLKHLSLRFDRKPSERIEFHHLFGTTSWSRLESLHLRKIAFHLFELQDFISCQPSLKELGLRDIRLRSGVVAELLDFLDGTFQPQKLHLCGTICDAQEELQFLSHRFLRTQIHNYVFGKTDHSHFS